MFMEEKNWTERIVVNPGIMAGKPVIRGTRITVEAIISRIAEGMTFNEIIVDFPYIKKEDITAAIRY